MTREMDLTDFRNDLTTVIDNLDETGPVRLLRYGLPVAELRPCTPAFRRAYTARWNAAIARLNELEINDIFAFDLGLDDVEELFARYDHLTAQGATFSDYPGLAFPAGGSHTVDELLAFWYFGEFTMPWEPVPWFEACVDLQRMAHQRGMDTKLPAEWDSADENSYLVTTAIASGYTPDTLRQFAQQHLDQGVQLHQLGDLMGEDSIPIDIVSAPGFYRHRFDGMVRAGLPHVEAVAIYRTDIEPNVAQDFARAGLRTAKEIENAVGAGIDPKVALRAFREGMTPEQWRQELPAIKHLRYTGDGLLPMPLLLQAAREGLSLVRWDNASLPVAKHRDGSGFTRERRAGLYPWKYVIPHGVLDLARANISVTYASEYARTMEHHYRGDDAPFVQDVIEVHRRGLDVDLMRAMRRTDRDAKEFRPTPSDLVALLDEGITAHQAHHLIEHHAKAADWIKEILIWHAMQQATTRFVTGIQGTRAWTTVRDFAIAYEQDVDKNIRWGDHIILEALPLLGIPERLMSIHLRHLIHGSWQALTKPYARWGHVEVFRQHNQHLTEDVAALWKEFDSMYQQEERKLLTQDG